MMKDMGWLLAEVPEPSTLLMLFSGAAALAELRARNRTAS
ncbi:MAG: PEP-CTERM sorting domain-containing protein [Pirellulales bacterium]|nr:PEP-CTERM sorting domain-containing protein [Pirellulales bacterium]